MPANLEEPIHLSFTFVNESTIRSLDILQYDEGDTRVIIVADSIEAARRVYRMPDHIVGESLVSEFVFAIPGIGVSIVDSSPRQTHGKEPLLDRLSHTEELFYTFVSGVMFNYCTTTAFVKRYLTISEVSRFRCCIVVLLFEL